MTNRTENIPRRYAPGIVGTPAGRQSRRRDSENRPFICHE